MSIFRDIIAVFKKKQRSNSRNQFFSNQIEDLFTFLSSKISSSNEAHATTASIKNYLKLGSNEQRNKLPESYLFVEKYLTDIDPNFTLSKTELRSLIKVRYANLLSIPDFALIFEREDQQEFELCKVFLVQVLSGLSDLLGESGSSKLQEIKKYTEELPSAFPSINPLNDTTFSPKNFDDWVQFLQRLSLHTFSILKEKIGEEAALRRFDNGYKILAQKYISLDTFQIVISLLPEKLMDEDRVSTLTKHQIERLLLKKADHFEQLTKDLSEKNEELRKTQQLLIEAKNTAEEASKTKAMFLANMSHEIRTPMNAVIGMTEILKQTDLSKEQILYIETIYKSGYDLIHIINDILDYSKIESGKLELEQREINIHDLVSDVTNLLVLKAEEKNIELISYVDETVPTVIEADSVRLKQILVNLIGNAIKFTQVGAVVLEVLAKKRTQKEIIIEFNIIDSGIGIPENKIAHIFDSFSQVDTTTTRNYGGTGLGLTITSSLVKMMNGEIAVESEMGKGSTFSFQISSPILESKPASSKIDLFDNKALFIADQNDLHRTYLTKKLTDWGFNIKTFSTLEEIIANLKKTQEVDIIVLDDFLLSSTSSILSKSFLTHLNSRKIPLVRVVPFGKTVEAYAESKGLRIARPLRRNELKNVLSQALTEKNIIEEITPQEELHEAKNLSILLAEDNRTNQLVAKGLLKNIGYEIEVAENGQEVLDKLKNQFYDLVLMDVQMPVLDGLQTTQKIRMEMASEKQPIIVAMTANASEEDKQVCLFSGMNDYLSKPVKKTEIIEKIEKWFPDK